MSSEIERFAERSEPFARVLSGHVTLSEFFRAPSSCKDQFMAIFNSQPAFKGYLAKGENFFDLESVAGAWITKLRFNGSLSDDAFISHIARADNIFSGNVDRLDLQGSNALGAADGGRGNDLLSIMWGIEVLNGSQCYDSGVTRVRLADGVSQRLLTALEDSGATKRASTHGTCTKLVSEGIGKDISSEHLRAFAPRGRGALLVNPVSCDGKPALIDANDKGRPMNQQLSRAGCRRFDLLLKMEDYGYKDSTLHTLVHSKVGFLNKLGNHSKEFYAGKKLITRYSELAEKYRKLHGKAKKIHRKEHISELKSQAVALVRLLDTGNHQVPPLFPDFTTKWVIRMKVPPFEKKIISARDGRCGVGLFLSWLSEQKGRFTDMDSQRQLDSVRSLLGQAAGSSGFAQMREGNEVMVDCSSGHPVLLDPIRKSSSDEPVHRADPALSEIVTTQLNESEYNEAVEVTFGEADPGFRNHLKSWLDDRSRGNDAASSSLLGRLSLFSDQGLTCLDPLSEESLPNTRPRRSED